MPKLSQIFSVTFLIVAAIECSFLEEMEKVYNVESVLNSKQKVESLLNSKQKADGELKMLSCKKSLLNASVCKADEDKSLESVAEPSRKRKANDKAIANSIQKVFYFLLNYYLDSVIGYLHRISKKLASSEDFNAASVFKQSATWKYVKWAHEFALLKKAEHEKYRNDPQYIFLEKYQNELLPHVTGNGIRNYDDLTDVCQKIIKYIVGPIGTDKIISNKLYPSVIEGFQKTAGVSYCQHFTENEDQRFAFQIAKLTTGTGVYYVLLDGKYQWQNMVQVPTQDNAFAHSLLLDVFQLSSEESFQDKSLVFNTAKV